MTNIPGERNLKIVHDIFLQYTSQFTIHDNFTSFATQHLQFIQVEPVKWLPGVWFLADAGIFLLSFASRPTLTFTQSPTRFAWRLFCTAHLDVVSRFEEHVGLYLHSIAIRRCIQKFPGWPPGARTANGIILWASLVSFAYKTLCVASQRVFIVVSVYFVIDSVQILLDTPSYSWCDASWRGPTLPF